VFELPVTDAENVNFAPALIFAVGGATVTETDGVVGGVGVVPGPVLIFVPDEHPATTTAHITTIANPYWGPREDIVHPVCLRLFVHVTAPKVRIGSIDFGSRKPLAVNGRRKVGSR
jgi:hypothetical protein